MNRIEIFKRLYKDYSKKYLHLIFYSGLFSILVAGSTSAIAWLLDPAIEKIFLEKDRTLLIFIPLLIILAFSTKGISLYIAKSFLFFLASSSWMLFRRLDLLQNVYAMVLYAICGCNNLRRIGLLQIVSDKGRLCRSKRSSKERTH